MYKISKEIRKKELFKVLSEPKRCANMPNGFVVTYNGQGLPSATVSMNSVTEKF